MRGNIAKGSRVKNFFIDKLLSDEDLDTFLAYLDAKDVLNRLLDSRGVERESFVREYIKRSHSMSVMGQVLPGKLVELMQELPV